jgi:hypothetical protein
VTCTILLDLPRMAIRHPVRVTIYLLLVALGSAGVVPAFASDTVWLECDETITSLRVHGPPIVVQTHNTYKIDAENLKVGEVSNAGTEWYSAEFGETSVRWENGVSITTIDRRTLTIVGVDTINSRFTNSSEGQCHKSDGPQQRQF